MNKHLNIHNWVVQLRVKKWQSRDALAPNTVINLLETTAVPVLNLQQMLLNLAFRSSATAQSHVSLAKLRSYPRHSVTDSKLQYQSRCIASVL